MIRMAVVSTLAFVLSIAALGVTYAQEEASPTPTVTPSPTPVEDDDDATVPEGAPQTGFGGF